MTDPQAAFVVVDFWRATTADTHLLDAELTQLARHFRTMPGVLSCDFTRVDGDAGRYMAIFRYADAAAREAFVSDPSAAVSESLVRLGQWWALDSPIYRGAPLQGTTP